jgi:hypothetical protein
MTTGAASARHSQPIPHRVYRLPRPHLGRGLPHSHLCPPLCISTSPRPHLPPRGITPTTTNPLTPSPARARATIFPPTTSSPPATNNRGSNSATPRQADGRRSRRCRAISAGSARSRVDGRTRGAGTGRASALSFFFPSECLLCFLSSTSVHFTPLRFASACTALLILFPRTAANVHVAR